MRPALKPGLETVWRNRDTVQIGIDPRRAIALTGMRGAAGLLRLLDGSRDRHQVLDAARDLGMDAAAADRVLTLLAAAGALDDFPAGGHGGLPAGTRVELAPELATSSLAHRDADGGARILARRQAARVRVHGASRAELMDQPACCTPRAWDWCCPRAPPCRGRARPDPVEPVAESGPSPDCRR